MISFLKSRSSQCPNFDLSDARLLKLRGDNYCEQFSSSLKGPNNSTGSSKAALYVTLGVLGGLGGGCVFVVVVLILVFIGISFTTGTLCFAEKEIEKKKPHKTDSVDIRHVEPRIHELPAEKIHHDPYAIPNPKIGQAHHYENPPPPIGRNLPPDYNDPNVPPDGTWLQQGIMPPPPQNPDYNPSAPDVHVRMNIPGHENQWGH